jgi:hypothetical protein
MNAQTEARGILSEARLFDCVRKHLLATGPTREVKYGIGLFFVLASRFLAYPLRLRIEQQTKGSCTHLVRRIAELLPPFSVAGFSGDMAKAWTTFQNHPEKKIFYIPPGVEMATSVQPTIAVRSDRLIRIDHAQLDSQSTQQRRELIRSFVCVSGQEVAPWKEESRWLTMKLEAPVTNENQEKGKSWCFEPEVWHEIQKRIEERMQLPFQMPSWEDLVIERICTDEYSSRSTAAILVSWKTMCALRSFTLEDERKPPKILLPDFADYAATAAVLRAAFKEGGSMPPAKSIFNQISAKGSQCSVANPITGAGTRYRHPGDPIKYEPLFQMAG